jgi:hypothetical protein
MTQSEIQERNKQIALMIGKKHQNNSIVVHYNNVCGVNPTGETWQECIFHLDWNWLMEAVTFIKKNIRLSTNVSNAKDGEYFIDEWEFKVNKYYVRLIQWTGKGWNMFDRQNKKLSMFYYIGDNCESEQQAVFLVVSDIAKLLNIERLLNENKQ